jgi:hypothetical protein
LEEKKKMFHHKIKPFVSKLNHLGYPDDTIAELMKKDYFFRKEKLHSSYIEFPIAIFEKYSDFTKSISLTSFLKDLVPVYMNYLRNAQIKYDNVNEYVTQGDIFYYNSQNWGYPFGHTALFLNYTLHHIVSKNGSSEIIPILYKAEHSYFESGVSFTDYIKQPPRLTNPERHVGITAHRLYYQSQLVSIQEQQRYPTSFRELKIIRYIGEKSEQVRATAILLAYWIIKSKISRYGAVLNVVFNSSFVSNGAHQRISEYIRMIETNKSIDLVCSGFVIFVYQIALYLNNVNVDECLPMDAKGCYPRDITKLPKKFPKYWAKSKLIGVSSYNVNNIEWGNYSDFYPIMKNVAPYRYHLSRFNTITDFEKHLLINNFRVNSSEFKYVPMDSTVSEYEYPFE